MGNRLHKSVGRNGLVVEPKEKGDYERVEGRRSSVRALAQTHDLHVSLRFWTLSHSYSHWLGWNSTDAIEEETSGLMLLKTTAASACCCCSWKINQEQKLKRNGRKPWTKEIIFFDYRKKKPFFVLFPVNVSFSLSLGSHIFLWFTECFLLNIMWMFLKFYWKLSDFYVIIEFLGLGV